MNPLRSISLLPKISEKQGNRDKYFRDVSDDNKYKHIPNYQVYDQTVDAYGTDISYITDIPDEKIFIEVSYKNDANQYVSRKFDFGNFLRYIGTALSMLDVGINDIYLTKQEADTYYLQLSGGTLEGPLTIDYNTYPSDALVINATNFAGPCGITINNGGKLTIRDTFLTTEITQNSISTKDITLNGGLSASGDIKTTNGKITAHGDIETTDGKITAHGDIETTNGNITANKGNLTAKSLYTLEGGTFSFAGLLYHDTENGNDRIIVNKHLITYGIDNSIINESITGYGMFQTKWLEVSENVTLEKNLTVNGQTHVKNLTVTKHEDDTGGTISTEGNIQTNSNIIVGNNITTHGNITADGGITAENGTIRGKTLKVNDAIMMDRDIGLRNTQNTSQLTAQYACWA